MRDVVPPPLIVGRKGTTLITGRWSALRLWTQLPRGRPLPRPVLDRRRRLIAIRFTEDLFGRRPLTFLISYSVRDRAVIITSFFRARSSSASATINVSHAFSSLGKPAERPALLGEPNSELQSVLDARLTICAIVMGNRGGMGHQPSYVPDHGDGSYHDGYGGPRAPQQAYADPYAMQQSHGE